MPKKFEITSTDFDRLLKWLDPDKAAAAEKYKTVHLRLVKMFLSRGVFPAEDLADQTFDRVTRKLPEIVDTYEGDPMPYIFRTARNLCFEFFKKPKSEQLPELPVLPEMNDGEDIEHPCLKECLEKISSEQRTLFLEYILLDGHEKKSVHHEALSQKLGIKINNLRTKIYRIRRQLEECVEKCASKKSL